MKDPFNGVSKDPFNGLGDGFPGGITREGKFEEMSLIGRAPGSAGISRGPGGGGGGIAPRPFA